MNEIREIITINPIKSQIEIQSNQNKKNKYNKNWMKSKQVN